MAAAAGARMTPRSRPAGFPRLFNSQFNPVVIAGWHGRPSLNGGFDMSKLFVRFLKNESGATAIEYGLIAAGISLAIIAVVNGLGTNLNTKFSDINSSLK
jgi:pilus assembly protein Flp/PilA